MNVMLAASHPAVQVTVSAPLAEFAFAAPERSGNGFFRGMLIGLGIMIPVWTGLIWLGLRLLNLG